MNEVNVIPSPAGCSPPLSVDAHTGGVPVHFFGGEIWCDPNALVTVTVGYDPTHTLVDKIRVRRMMRPVTPTGVTESLYSPLCDVGSL